MGDFELPQSLHLALRGVRSVGVITGAGISAESGIPTYRGKGGIYDDPQEGDRTIEDLSAHTLADDPDRTWRAPVTFTSSRMPSSRAVPTRIGTPCFRAHAKFGQLGSFSITMASCFSATSCCSTRSPTLPSPNRMTWFCSVVAMALTHSGLISSRRKA
ncbi:MAG: hypothetical protein IPP14_00375 [Planctomycetes bacterium]|nr:hypothetical protein [Planctomycetota bacterium]